MVSAEERKAARKWATTPEGVPRPSLEIVVKLLDALEAAESEFAAYQKRHTDCFGMVAIAELEAHLQAAEARAEKAEADLQIEKGVVYQLSTRTGELVGSNDALRDEVERLREAGERVVAMWKLAGSARFENYKPGFHARDLSFAMSDLDTALSSSPVPATKGEGTRYKDRDLGDWLK